MNPDYIIMSVIFVICVAGGLYLKREARRYRESQDSERARRKRDCACCHCCHHCCCRGEHHTPDPT